MNMTVAHSRRTRLHVAGMAAALALAGCGNLMPPSPTAPGSVVASSLTSEEAFPPGSIVYLLSPDQLEPGMEAVVGASEGPESFPAITCQEPTAFTASTTAAHVIFVGVGSRYQRLVLGFSRTPPPGTRLVSSGPRNFCLGEFFVNEMVVK